MGIKILLTTVIGILLLANMVFAQPGVPNAFYGTVTLNGQPAPDGTVIVAKIGGVQIATTTTKDGKYGYDPIFYVEDPYHGRSGAIINFFVNGVDTGQFSYFCNGCVTMLNLTATVTTDGQPSGVGGGTGIPTLPEKNETEETGEEEIPQPCRERWLCTDWSECIDGIQTRECEDVNNCGTDLDKPLESQPCLVKEVEISPALGITGLVIGVLSNPVYASIIAIIIITAIVVVLRKRYVPIRKGPKKGTK